MQEIKCPKCGTVISVEESDYAEIVKQVRDKEFNKEIKAREAQFASEKENALILQETKARADLDAATAKAKADYVSLQSRKDSEIAELKAKIASSESEKKLAVNEAIAEKDKTIAEKDTTIVDLNSKLSNAELIKQNEEKSLKELYEMQLKAKDAEIAFYKDFKARLSTKGLGESLEQYCMNEFNKVRATGFQNAYFEKDNDAKNGSKGDFVFRDKTSDGEVEFISIMFEMKNEADETVCKHKNEDFLEKLDKDRREKNCEYAVLVSVLEQDSELYNNGIVDMSHKYEKMYVIRPQFFIPMITLLRNAALNSISLKKELILAQSQSIDITNFEDKLGEFKEKFGKDCQLASDRFKKAIDEIDKSINHLQKIKDFLTGADNHLKLANTKAEDLTIRKLTWQNPTMKAKFEEARTASSENLSEIVEENASYVEVTA